MAPKSGFFTTNNTGDAPSTGYTLADWQRLFKLLYISDNTQEALVKGYSANCICTATGANQVTVQGGGGVVNGFWYDEPSNTAFTVASVASATRKDLIVLRADSSAQTVRLVYKSGSEGGAVPTVTQSGSTWEIALWEVWMAVGGGISLIDRRHYLKDALLANISADGSTLQLVANTLSIKNGGVGTTQLADDSVTGPKIAAGAVGASEIADGSVGNAELADTSVTTNKLGNNAVDLSKQSFLKHGYIDIVNGGVPGVNGTVTFSPAFSGTPDLALAIISSPVDSLLVRASSLSASGCTISVLHASGSAWSGTVRVSWIAAL